MKKILIVLLLSTIGFSQNCENPILDEVLQNSQINQYFQLALSLNITDLNFLNNCDTDLSYTMFAPSNNVPNSSVLALQSLPGELMDYISYYISIGDVNYNNLSDNSPLLMMDNNTLLITTNANDEYEIEVHSSSINADVSSIGSISMTRR